MTQSQPPYSNEWLQANITPSFLVTLLSKAGRSGLETEIHRHLLQLIQRGTRSEVYKLTIPSPSSQDTHDLTVVLKRYLSPMESVQMRAGLAPPSDEQRPVDQHEYINLFHFRNIVPDQVRPYLYDPERHIVVMEALSGDYDTRLNGFYNDFLKAARKKDIQIDIKQRVVQDLDILLSRAHKTMSKATQFALVNPNQLVLLFLERKEFNEVLDAKYNALHSAASNITIASLIGGHKPEFIIQSHLTQVADNNRLTSWMKRYDFYEERKKLIAYLLKTEGVVHRDLRPENVLIRASKPSLETVLADFAEMGWGPVDQDMVTFLMDSRLKKMFTLQERRAIYDRHLDEELLPCYDIAQQFQTPEARTLRFSTAAINTLLSDIRFTVTYPQQADPARSLATGATGGNLKMNPTSRRFPLPDIRDHFTTQFLSLAQILSTVQEEFPRLYQGIISFYPKERRAVFQNAIADESKHGIMTSTLSKLFEKGRALRQHYSPNGYAC